MIATIIVAIAGLLTTGAAPLLQSRLESRREDVSWNRDHRADVYAEALHHAQLLDSSIARLIDPMTTSARKSPPEVAHVDQITAKMRLVASRSTLEAWQALRQFEDGLWWNLSEDFPGLGQPDSWDGVPIDYPSLVNARQALDSFYAATRKEFAAE